MTFDGLANARTSMGTTLCLFAGAGACWLLAMTETLETPPPMVVVGVPDRAVSGSALPVRVIAVDRARKTRLPGLFAAAVVPVGSRLPRDVSWQHPPFDVDVPVGAGPWALVVEGPQHRSPPAHVALPVELVRSVPDRSAFTFHPWKRAVISGQGPPLYPLDGEILATRTNEVLVLLDPATGPNTPIASIESIEGNPALTQDASGRTLRVRQDDTRILAPLSVAPGEAFVVTVSPEEVMEVDLVVGGWARSASLGRTRAQLVMPADVTPGEAFVVHVSDRPFPQARGAYAIGRVGVPREGERGVGTWAAELAIRHGAVEDPLATHLLAGRVPPALEAAATRALLQRLEPKTVRAPRRGPSSQQQLLATEARRHAQIARWRTPFRVLAGLAALSAMLLAWVFARDARRVRQAVDAHDDDARMGAGQTRASIATALWGAFGLAVALSMFGLLDWVLG